MGTSKRGIDVFSGEVIYQELILRPGKFKVPI